MKLSSALTSNLPWTLVLVKPLPAAGRYWLVAGVSWPGLAVIASRNRHCVPVGPALAAAMP